MFIYLLNGLKWTKISTQVDRGLNLLFHFVFNYNTIRRSGVYLLKCAFHQ